MKRPAISISIALAMLFAAAEVTGAELACSIHPPKATAQSALSGMAKVTETDARKTALASFSANTAKIVEAELEVERGCLIYSFDITVLGKDGVEEVWIDAGSGQLLAREHETAQHEATEATLENVEPSNR